MAQAERKFMVRFADNEEEFGPVDQEGLVRWAQNGRVTAECQVRNAMLTRWNRPQDLPFLKEIIEEQEKANQKDPGVFGKIKERAAMKAKEPKKLKGLHTSGTFAFTPGSIQLRLGAALMDLSVIAAGSCLLLALLVNMFAGTLGMKSVAYVWFALTYVLAIIYLTWMVGFRAQTLGQRFWGLLVVCKEDGAEVLMGRAFVFSLGALLFGILNPLLVYMLPSRRGAGDIISGTRVVRTRVIHGI